MEIRMSAFLQHGLEAPFPKPVAGQQQRTNRTYAGSLRCSGHPRQESTPGLRR